PGGTMAGTDQPWSRDAAAVAAALGTDPDRGLGAEEAAARLARDGPNRLDAAVAEPEWRQCLRQFADPLVYLLFAAVAISLLTWVLDGAEGVPFEALVILVILVANAVLGYVQEERAEQAVAALQQMAAPVARVVRDGVEDDVPAGEVVPGDVLLLAEG